MAEEVAAIGDQLNGRMQGLTARALTSWEATVLGNTTLARELNRNDRSAGVSMRRRLKESRISCTALK